jgi:ketosteroid isomerase-like protein/predicted enzyme related to lactoylglutathione lyase
MPIIDRTLAVLSTDDIARAEAWFERFFGRPADASPMPVLREWHEGSGGIAVFEQADQAGNGFVTMLVDSLDAHRAQLVERGLQLGATQAGDQSGVAQIKDPSGNTITLAQRRAQPESGTDAARVVRSFFEAFRDRRREDFDALMDPGFTFTSQYDDHIGREAFYERSWPNGDRFDEVRVERIVPDSEGAFITYYSALKTGESFRNTEYLTVSNGKVTSSTVYFGANYLDGKQVVKTPA